MRRFLASFIFLFTLAVLTEPSFAGQGNERILSFDVKAQFQEDGAMRVIEEITVLAKGENIRRGIIRELPLSWRRADGKLFRVEYTVESVARNGKSEAYTEKRAKDFLNIRIGLPEQSLSPGRHTYAITYRVKNHFSRFSEWDELYWNVTGNGWAFPIDKASFSLSFSPRLAPDGVLFTTIDFYTGSYGEQGTGATTLPDGTIETTQPLRTGEGLTVAYTWPLSVMSHIQAPAQVSSLERYFLPTSGTWGYWLVPLLMAAYYTVTWLRLRAKGERPTVIPLFGPPDGLSPGKLRYVIRKGYGNTSFSADLLNIIAKGGISLVKDAQKTPARWLDRVLKRVPINISKATGHGLSTEEKRARNYLFRASDEVDLSKPHQKDVHTAMNYLESKCAEEHEKLFISTGKHWFKGILPVVALPVLAAFFHSGMDAIGSAMFFAFFFIFASALLHMTLSIVKDVSSALEFIAYLPFFAFTGVFWFTLGTLAYHITPLLIENSDLPDGYIGAMLLCFAIIAVSRLTRPVYTAEGFKRLAIARGLKMYLGTAERHRFETLYPPELSVRHFESLLPYALALGVGRTWANRFDEYLQDTGLAPENLDTIHHWDEVNRFARSSSRAAATRSSGSSGGSSGRSSGSGSRGGGSSGGGSGGGGGRGW